jgi:hypothetical protein
LLLVITGSGDFTANYIFDRLGDRAFRLNFDLFSDYNLYFSPDYWEIRNPAGLTISSHTATACFWLKPFNFYLEQEEYVVEEVKYVLREIYSWFALRGKIKGNSGLFHQIMGKINILNIASKHFKVPTSAVLWGAKNPKPISICNPVAKSLSSGLITTNKALFATPVDASLLDLRYPWFLQEKIEAEFDLTVQYVGSRIFGFARSRRDLKNLDWRQDIFTSEMDKNSWKPVEFSDSLKVALQNFASDLGVQWGRADLIGSLDEPYFLEFNANGQWLFLDSTEKNGLADAVIEYLSAQGMPP